ncbi:MAG: hypothetical protein BJ554DRAFT_3129 [Olpidium bornovanus]|uniref:Uncharacterized protein n=1 Tax=Olpidium bornovanus TaxID=278681 RepID=A0A8H8A0Z5_9FUNG|nr:MAG: hypothetical protein BJ554DRAFT_3129 [Olpidium bornovanus]
MGRGTVVLMICLPFSSWKPLAKKKTARNDNRRGDGPRGLGFVKGCPSKQNSRSLNSRRVFATSWIYQGPSRLWATSEWSSRDSKRLKK